MNDSRIKVRILVVLTSVAVAMVGLGSRLAYLQLGPHEETVSDVSKNQRVQKRLLANRGAIHDCHGSANIVAISLTRKKVGIDPWLASRSNDLQQVSAKLASGLGLSKDEVFQKVRFPDRRYVCVQRMADEGVAERLRASRLPGLVLEDIVVRHYPQKSFMCHVLGFVNHDGIGCGGIEQKWDGHLRGCAGLIETRVNALRQEIYTKRDHYIAPLRGGSVSLTIDQNIQYMLEKALDVAMDKHNAKGAWAIIQRVRTGEILAMASRPSFDPNEFARASNNEFLNRTLGYTYEPGSTFKVVAISAAINEGIVTPDMVFDCENGAWTHAGHVLRDFHPYGRLTLADGVKKSSNIMTAKVALMLGAKRQYLYMKAFGIGEKSGVDLPGEEGGILSRVQDWSSLSPSRMAIGQGVAVTAVQMLNVYCTIANDGYMMKPHIVSVVRDGEGNVVFRSAPEVVGRPISSETAGTMRILLRRVTDDGGTGSRARVPGFDVAGKTGTAQKAIPGGYSSTANIASFVGFLPAEDPEVGMIVVVDEPQPLHTGGVVAAPVFSSVAGQVVRYLEIQPHQSVNMVAARGEPVSGQ